MMDKTIEKQVIVPASQSQVWNVWTSASEATTFLARKANVELKIGGRYEMLFNLDAPPGFQGGEGLKVLSYLPQDMLSFEWNAPPEIPTVRNQKTWVVVQFEAVAETKTQVKLTHLGWGQGDDWDEAYAYFQRAWDVVLGRLVYRFEVGPIDWSNPYYPEGVG